MKIYRRSEFLKLPSGTIYSKGKPWAFGELLIKDDTLRNWSSDEIGDWFYVDPVGIESNDCGEELLRLDQMLETGASFPMNTNIVRDGCFNLKDVFLVFEKEDLIKLREYINTAIDEETEE
jgi:hypothetical protein